MFAVGENVSNIFAYGRYRSRICSILKEYGEKICPKEGKIDYFDEKVLCSVHPGDDIGESDEEEDGSVPFL